jgi:hypothetical protein
MTNYIATEKDIRPTIDNFEIFCRYIEERKPKLTKAKGEIGKKDCFAINALLSKPRELDGPKYLQPSYPTINLFFHIVLEIGLFILKSQISSAHSLHHLHEAIQEAFEFNNDHAYAFFMDGRPWSQNAYWDRNAGDSPFADRATVGKLELVNGQKILYLFDFGDEWMFTVRVDEILYSDVPPVRPVVVEKRGDAPVQYPDCDE